MYLKHFVLSELAVFINKIFQNFLNIEELYVFTRFHSLVVHLESKLTDQPTYQTRLVKLKPLFNLGLGLTGLCATKIK